jgi:hypothetical protein
MEINQDQDLLQLYVSLVGIMLKYIELGEQTNKKIYKNNKK